MSQVINTQGGNPESTIVIVRPPHTLYTKQIGKISLMIKQKLKATVIKKIKVPSDGYIVRVKTSMVKKIRNLDPACVVFFDPMQDITIAAIAEIFSRQKENSAIMCYYFGSSEAPIHVQKSPGNDNLIKSFILDKHAITDLISASLPKFNPLIKPRYASQPLPMQASCGA